LGKYVEEQLPQSNAERDTMRALDIIRSYVEKPIPHQDALKKFRHGAERFKKALTTLIEQGSVKRIAESCSGNRSTAVFYA
jgi:hypothetical protein